jgi:hypothetical protein
LSSYDAPAVALGHGVPGVRFEVPLAGYVCRRCNRRTRDRAGLRATRDVSSPRRPMRLARHVYLERVLLLFLGPEPIGPAVF